MKMQKVKEFVNRNKTTFIVIGSTIVGVALAATGMRVAYKKRLNGGDMTWFNNMCKDIDICMDGSDRYTIVTEAAEIEGLLTKNIVKDPNGKLLNIKSLMVFGNEITEN